MMRRRLGNKDIHLDANSLRVLWKDAHEYMYSLAGDLSVDTGGLRAYNRFGITLYIQEVHISVGTAPTGAAIIVDVHKNGTTIFTDQGNRPQIAAGANAGFTTMTIANNDVKTFAHNDYFTVDVDQVGSSVAGSDLNVIVLVG